MARAVKDWLRDRNPLRCGGTLLPANVLLAAKLIVLCAFGLGYVQKVPEPYLPLLSLFEGIPRADLVRTLLQAAMLAAGTGLLLNLCVRGCSLVVGLVFLAGPLVARASYTNGKFFCACILILIGLWSGRHFLRLLRAQFVIMYAGSALNKLLDADWRSGQYMDFWLGSLRPWSAYSELAAILPEMALAKFLCWGTIAAEFTLAVGLARPSTTRPSLWLLVVLHTTSVLLAGHTFGIFYSVLLAACLLLLPWPERGDVRVSCGDDKLGSAVRMATRWLDFDRVFAWEGPSEGTGLASLRLRWGDRAYRGGSALALGLALFPLSYGLVYLPVTQRFFEPALQAAATVAIAALCFLPTLGLGLGVARTDQLAKN